MNDKLPKLNNRIKELIDILDNGNVSKFVKRLENVSQQRLNRIFNLDTRTKKYPSVPDDVIMDIAYHIPNINLDWLLMGEEPMLKDGGNISNNDNALLLSLFEKEQSKNYTLCKEIGALQNELASKRKESEMLSKRISELQIDLKNVRDAYNATNDAKDSVQELPEVPAMLIPELNTEYINQKNK